jgi:hypothetical protein
MHHDEIIAQLAEKNQRLLYAGTPNDVIAETLIPSFFQVVSSTDTEYSEIANDFDTVIFSDILEIVDDPRQLIAQLKWHAKSSIIYEFKYDHMDAIDESWKTPWKNIGLEHILTWEFDYVKSVYLGYATVYFCEGPNKYTPEEISKGVSVNQE